LARWSKEKESQPDTDTIKGLIGIELPEGDFEILKEEDKQQVKLSMRPVSQRSRSL